MKGYHSHKIYNESVWRGKFELMCDSDSTVAIHKEGNFAAIAGANYHDKVELWDIRSNPVPMTSVPLPDVCTSGNNEVHTMFWSSDGSHLCALVDVWTAGEKKREPILAVQRYTQYLVTWGVRDESVVATWAFPVSIASACFVPGSNEVAVMAYSGAQGSAVKPSGVPG